MITGLGEVVECVVDNKLRLTRSPPAFADRVKREFTYPNPAYEKARRMGIWDLPPRTVETHALDGGALVLPRGGAAKVRGVAADMGVRLKFVDQRQTAPVEFPTDGEADERRHQIGFEFTPRQQDVIEALIQRQNAYLHAATGMGKTASLIEVVRRVGQRCLFLVPDTGILQQTIDVVDRLLGVGYAGKLASKPHELPAITCTTYAMAHRAIGAGFGNAERFGATEWAAQLLLSFGMVVCDECFPAGTLIGDTPIEAVRVGDLVPSYDERTGERTWGRVTKRFVRRTSSLVRVTFAGRTVVCTPGHPFLTDVGWLPAIDICGRKLLSYWHAQELYEMQWAYRASESASWIVRQLSGGAQEGAGQDRTDDLRRVFQTGHADRSWWVFQFGACPPGEGLLFGDMPDDMGRTSSCGDYDDRQSSRCRTYAGQDDRCESDEKESCAREGIPRASGTRAQTHSEGRERSAVTIGAAIIGGRSWVGDGSGGLRSRQVRGRIAISDLLQDRYCQSHVEDRYRSGRRFSQQSGPAQTGPEEGDVPAWARVDRVEVLEPAGTGEFERVCPGGLVYNLAVEGTQTYLVGGAVVHNCQFAAARTVHNVVEMMPAKYRFAMSADSTRKDGKEFFTYDSFGQLADHITVAEAVAEGRILQARMVIVPTGLRDPDYEAVMFGRDATPSPRVRRELYQVADDLLRASPARNRMIASRVAAAWRAGHYCLVLARRIEHCEELQALIEDDTAAEVLILQGGNKQAFDDACNRLRNGDCRIAVGTSKAYQGLDIPRLDRGFIATPTATNPQLLEQMIGRFRRVADGKTDAVVEYYWDEKIFPGHKRKLQKQYGNLVTVEDPR